MRGFSIPLSPMRRFVCDLLHAAREAPTVPVQRRMRLGSVVLARANHPGRIPWSAIFIKAFAKVAAEIPELRRAYVKFPWARLYEYPKSVASVAVEREHKGERGVFFGRVNRPDTQPLSAIAERIRTLQTAPFEELPEFCRMLQVSRLPWPLRRWLWWFGLNLGSQRGHFFGTFALSVYSGLGSESLHPLSPITTTLTYGVIDDQGDVDVRLIYDHRVMDGSTVARALARLEEELTTSLVAELRETTPTRQLAA
ncbi:MAG: hypothetical protein K2X38_12190 [Gemmataceae bacterium]|nr:hypothetical protein [Gemmataceae bacterium]